MQHGELTTRDGRTLRWYDAGPTYAPLTLMWHHGTPNTGEPPAPLLEHFAAHGIRWIGFSRPAYPGTTRVAHRTVGDVAADAIAVADHARVDQFAVWGHSGGGPHALAAAAANPDRVIAAVSIAGLAPSDAPGLDFFEGMTQGGVHDLQAAQLGVDARRARADSAEDDPAMFIAADVAMFDGPWGWFGRIVAEATANGPGGLVDDDIAYMQPWGFDPGAIAVPVLLMHGDADRIVPAAHSRWLADAIPRATIHTYAGEGHLSVLQHSDVALDWIVDQAMP